jgi:type 1 glutamine amidotransferase
MTLAKVYTRVLTLLVFTCLCGAAALSHAEDAAKARLAIIFADNEYYNDAALEDFAKKHLAEDFEVDFIKWDQKDSHNLLGIEKLNDADVMLVSARRRVLPKSQLDEIRKFVAAGKPVVGIRTASHAFSVKKGTKLPPTDAETDQWPEFDHDVLGGSYHGHDPAMKNKEIQTYVKVAPEAGKHPILEGMSTEEFPSAGTLYLCAPLQAKAELLLIGRRNDGKEAASQPVAWTNVSPAGGRVFFTSLGHLKDFAQPEFVRLLRNGIYWSAGKEPPKS